MIPLVCNGRREFKVIFISRKVGSQVGQVSEPKVVIVVALVDSHLFD